MKSYTGAGNDLYSAVRQCSSRIAHLEVLPELHEVGHVNLVEGGQHGVGVLGALEALGHTGTQAGHLHPPLGPAWLAGGLVCRGWRSPRGLQIRPAHAAVIEGVWTFPWWHSVGVKQMNNLMRVHSPGKVRVRQKMGQSQVHMYAADAAGCAAVYLPSVPCLEQTLVVA